MSLLMRIYLCFTTDTRDLNGLVEIMFHQHRVTITQNILGGQVLSMFLMPLMTLHGVSTSSTQSKSSKIRKSLQMRMQEEERKATLTTTKETGKCWWWMNWQCTTALSSWRTSSNWTEMPTTGTKGVSTSSSSLYLEMSWVETDSFKSVDTSRSLIIILEICEQCELELSEWICATWACDSGWSNGAIQGSSRVQTVHERQTHEIWDQAVGLLHLESVHR